MRVLALLFMCLAVAACGSAGDKERLEGDRLALVDLKKEVEVDPYLLKEIELPAPRLNKMWLQLGGDATASLGHLALRPLPEKLWSRDIGAGNGTGLYNFAQPVVAGNGVFTMDTHGVVSAFRLRTGKEMWGIDLSDELDEESAVNGALALGMRRLFAVLGNGHLFALNPATGKVLWHQHVGGLIRTAPSYSEGRVYVMTLDNVVYAYDVETGERLWSYQGLGEQAAVLGNSGIAVAGEVVVAPLSNGEIVALKADTGRILWLDSLALGRSPLSQVANIIDNRAKPVINQGRLFVSSNVGRIGAFEAATGKRLWSREVGGTQSPYAAGEYLFLVDNTQKVYCLSQDEGRALWVRQLPAYEDAEDKEDPITWAGPVVAGGHLILTSSTGDVVFLNPNDGETVHMLETSDAIYIPPVVVDGSLIVIDEDADLTVLR